jgi:hypothetical protein
MVSRHAGPHPPQRGAAFFHYEEGIPMNLAKRFALAALCFASLAQAKGWTVVDMKNDWKIIYPVGKR